MDRASHRPVLLLLQSFGQDQRLHDARKALSTALIYDAAIKSLPLHITSADYTLHVIPRNELVDSASANGWGDGPEGLVRALTTRVESDLRKRVGSAGGGGGGSGSSAKHSSKKSALSPAAPKPGSSKGAKPMDCPPDLYLLDQYPWSLSEAESLLHWAQLSDANVCLDGVVALTDKPLPLPEMPLLEETDGERASTRGSLSTQSSSAGAAGRAGMGTRDGTGGASRGVNESHKQQPPSRTSVNISTVPPRSPRAVDELHIHLPDLHPHTTASAPDSSITPAVLTADALRAHAHGDDGSVSFDESATDRRTGGVGITTEPATIIPYSRGATLSPPHTASANVPSALKAAAATLMHPQYAFEVEKVTEGLDAGGAPSVASLTHMLILAQRRVSMLHKVHAGTGGQGGAGEEPWPLTEEEEEAYVDEYVVPKPPPPEPVAEPSPAKKGAGGKKGKANASAEAPPPEVPAEPSPPPKPVVDFSQLLQRQKGRHMRDAAAASRPCQGWANLQVLKLPVLSTEDGTAHAPQLLALQVVSWAISMHRLRCRYAEHRRTMHVTPLPLTDTARLLRALDDAAKLYETAGGSVSTAPPAPDTWDTHPTLKRYRQLNTQMPEACATVAWAVHCLVRAVAEAGPIPLHPIDQQHYKQVDAELTTEVKGLGPGVICTSHGDDAAVRQATAEASLSPRRLPSTLLISIQRAFTASLPTSQLVGPGRFPEKREQSDAEVSVDETELLNFTDRAIRDLHRERQCEALEELVDAAFLDVPRVTHTLLDSVYTEKMPSYVLQQVLAKERLRCPRLLYRYYRPSDTLLLAVVHPTAKRRMGRTVFEASRHVTCVPDFLTWKDSVSAAQGADRGAAGKKERQQQYLDLSPPDLHAASSESVHLFPSDHSLMVRCTRQTQPPTSHITVYGHDGHTLGLHASQTHKSQGVFVASFDDGARLTVTPRPPTATTHTPAHTHIDVHYTLPHQGLTVTVGSDGHVSMRHVTACRESLPAGVIDEVCRALQSPYTVTRRLLSGVTEVLHVDGSVTTHRPPAQQSGTSAGPVAEPSETCVIRTNADGRRQHVRGPFPVDGEPTAVGVKSGTDPTTRAHVSVLHSGVMIVRYATGDAWVRHADGSSFRRACGGERVLVEAPGYPSVEWLTVEDDVARKHARRVQVPIARGGERIRCRLALPDGTCIVLLYDTANTARVRGKVMVVRPDKTVIVATDAQKVVYKPRGLWTDMTGARSHEEDDMNVYVTQLCGPDTAGSNATHSTTSRHRRRSSVSKSSVSISSNSSTTSTTTATSATTAMSPPIHIGGQQQQQSPEDVGDGGVWVEGPWIRTTDSGQNTFIVPLTGKVHTDLAGEMEGVEAHAVIEDPVPPRVFVIDRSGSGAELMRHHGVQGFLHDLEREGLRVARTVAQRHAESRCKPCEVHTFHIHHRDHQTLSSVDGGGLVEAVFGAEDAEKWAHTRVLPQLAKTWTGHVPEPRPPRTTLVTVRALEKREASTLADREAVSLALEKWTEFQMQREADNDRFRLEDPRPVEALEEEAVMIKELKKAYRAAKAAKRRQREHARQQQRALQGEEKREPSPRMNVVEGEASGLDPVLVSALAAIHESPEEDEDDPFAEESEPEDEVEELVDVELEEDEAAFEANDPDGRGYVDIHGLHTALIQTLSVYVDPDHLLGQLQGDPFRSFDDGDKVSFSDFRRLAQELRSQNTEAVPAEQPLERVVGHSELPVGGSNTGSFWATSKGAEARTTLKVSPCTKTKGSSTTRHHEPSYTPRRDINGQLSVEGPPLQPPSPSLELSSSVDNDSVQRLLDAASSGHGLVVGDAVHVQAPQSVQARPMVNNSNSSSNSSKNPKHMSTEPHILDASSLRATDLVKLNTTELEAIAAGSGRNAARASAVLKHQRGERLVIPGRLADVHVTGELRTPPVRLKRPLHPPDALQARYSAGTPSRAAVFGVEPTRIDIGEIAPGATYHARLRVVNLGDVPAKFRVELRHDPSTARVMRSVSPQRGALAAGLGCTLHLRMSSEGEPYRHISSHVEIWSEAEVLRVPVTGTVTAPGTGEGGQVDADTSTISSGESVLPTRMCTAAGAVESATVPRRGNQMDC